MIKNILLVVMGSCMIVLALVLARQTRLQEIGADAIMECQIATSSVKAKLEEGKAEEAYTELSGFNQTIKQTASDFITIKYSSLWRKS